MAAKTFRVEELRGLVNYSLANSVEEQTQEMAGMIAILEQVLHDSGNYHGFTYLEQREVPPNCIPGIRPEQDDKFENTNQFRRKYY
jgi:hypothetical protein